MAVRLGLHAVAGEFLLGFVLGLVLMGVPSATQAQQTGVEERPVERPGRTGLPLPRFASLRSDEVNLRTGPGVRYPIEWVYRRQWLPVEIVDEFDTWRRIRDWEGTLGWVHQSMLSGRRTLRVQDGRVGLRREPNDEAALVAWLEAGVIGEIKRCEGGWCAAEVEGYEGWLKRSDFYGTLPREDLR